MALRDHIKYMEPGVGEEGYYYVLLDLRSALNPNGTKYGSTRLVVRPDSYTNHDVEREVVLRLAERYGVDTVKNINGMEPGPRCFELRDPLTDEVATRVDFDSEMGAFGMQAVDSAMLVAVCDVIDVLAAEAQGEPSFAEVYDMRFDDVPDEYKRLISRALRLARLRKQVAEGSGAELVVGYEKSLVHRAYDQVMELDDVAEQDLTPG